MLERYHADFTRAGARLGAAEQKRYADIMGRLAELTTQFGQNVLADEAAYRLVLRTESELAGLPDFVRAAARQAGVERGIDGCVITLSRSHVVPFLTFSDRRDLREQVYRAWTTRGEHAGPTDNRPLAREILALRREQARLHGCASYADYALAESMARRPANVTELLEQVWAPACARAATEREALEALALSRDEPSRIEAWDWRYYAEKVRKVRYDFDEAQVKPYFPLDRMTAAAFDCAARLFGLKFIEQPQVKAYHPDVKVYEVRGADGALVGVFLHDNFARPAKRSGAWMGSYRVQSRIGGAGGEAVVPIVVNNNNFAKAALGEPTLLSFDDARTLFHEFGHGLHGLLSSVTYERVAGTNVLRDFVELPSQIFEHWLSEPEVLKRHARHYATHEPIPDALVERLHAARFFNQGYETVRYTASALVDMAAHAARCRRRRLRHRRVRTRRARPHRPAGRRRHEPPPAAFPAPVRRLRLCGRLLRVPVGRSARGRRLRGLRRGRRPVRSGGRGAPAPLHLLGRRFARAVGGVPGVSRPHTADRADAAPARPA